MVRIYLLLFYLLSGPIVFSQQSVSITIKDSVTGKPLESVTIKDSKLHKNYMSDSIGQFVYTTGLKDTVGLSFSLVGYQPKFIHVSLQENDTSRIIILLVPSLVEIDEIIIQSTRTNRSQNENPTRIEAITPDELDEKGTMKPGDIRMLLNESTGITTQTTSAVSGLATLRIQGLDGRYTQLLKDGMPLYSGFSGGLGILQIAPLDLKQVELIKGSAATLYGGGAIAGLVNLITKTPGEKPELNFLLNANSGKGIDLNGFYSEKGKTIGTTIFSSYNYNGAYDPAGIGLTAIPKTSRFTFNPKVFFYFPRTAAWFGINTTVEERYGGDLAVIKGYADNVHQYFEKNKSSRISSQLSVVHTINPYSKLSFKNSIGFFNRELILPGTSFKGNQWSSFTEASYIYHKNKIDWVAGINESTEKFIPLDTTRLTYNQSTVGVFVQHTYKVNRSFSVESGIRLDHSSPATENNPGKLYVLPRLNLLYKISPQVTSRIGGGIGYKMPTPFIEDAEKIAYRNIMPINIGLLNAEKSYGVHADINYKIHHNKFTLSINQLLFYTRLDDPIRLQGNTYLNAKGYLDSRGAETNIKIGLDELALYLGYSYTDAVQHYNGQSLTQPLTAKNRVNADLTYEIENKFRLGLESFYTSRQLLSDGTTGNAYITFGALVQKMWTHISLFVNVENLTDQRQSRWGNLYTGNLSNPLFTDVYAPLEGRIINGGFKWKIK